MRPFASFLFLVIPFCTLVAQKLVLSTASDSCLYYYTMGWKHVMDEGDYTASEAAYRRMMKADPEFLVGMALLGRISNNAKERMAIEEVLNMRKDKIHGDERMLLDVYMQLLALTNARDKEPELATQLRETTFNLAERNLFRIAHAYPDDVYTKAEYFEVLHFRHGPAKALDSLRRLSSVQQRVNPFILGFAAELEAELGKYDEALSKASELKKLLDGKHVPKVHVVLGDIYLKMGRKSEASLEIEIALKLDPNNIDARRLKQRAAKMR